MKPTFYNFFLLLIFFSIFNCERHTTIKGLLSEKFSDGNLNGNILVIKNGQNFYQNSFGYSNASKNNELTKDFRFDIGSIYKEFPAVSIMQLQEKELLDVNDRINKYLNDLPDWSSKITIKNLLQYTSGLPEVQWDKYFSVGDEITDEKIKNDLLSINELDFEPGTDYLYTNHSPLLLSQIVEQVTNITFKDYVEKNLFMPFSLKNAVINDEFPFLDKTLMAMPFNEDYEKDPYKVKLSGSMFSLSVSDLKNWLDHLHAFKVIKKESLKFLSEEADFYGNIQSPLGNVKWEEDRVLEHTHHGSAGNYEGIIRRFNDGNDVITIIILTNQKHKNVGDISEEIYRIVSNK